MNFLMENWSAFVGIGSAVFCGAVFIYHFANLPTKAQIAKVREWLLWAVTCAESELGGGTGQLKLRSVYDLFVQRFPKLARWISFERFSELVDDALAEMREMLSKNEAVKAIVEGDTVE